MNSSRTVASRLADDVAARRLMFDGSQSAAALRLDALSAELRSADAAQGLKRLRYRITGRRSDAAPRGVYLWGGVGRGKTLLMDWFFATVAGGERSHFYRFMRRVHGELASIQQREQPLEILAQRLAKQARFICLDEFFVSDISDAMILSGLLAGLFRRGVCLVATSNLPPEDLYKDGLQRQRFLPAIDLLRAHVDVLRLDGGVDYRLRQLQMAPTYLDSTLPLTASEMQERFRALTGGVAAGRTTLTIEGRPVHAVDVAAGTVWFEFAELCLGPRSQNDYIELAHLYQTIFLGNVPRLGADDENAARRFIMLIDELYDRGVKLVISAAAPPTALYCGERLRFEFERAASRLIEMQTQQYLAGQHRP